MARRKALNPRYSMRAYAARIGCDPSAICRILSGKQEVSLRLAKKIVRKLTLEMDQKRRFLRSVVSQQSDLTAAELAKILNVEDLETPVYDLPSEVYRRVSDPETMAVLECHQEDLAVDVEGIAEHLALSTERVREAISVLAGVGLLVPNAGGKLVKAAAQVRADPTKEPEANAAYYEKLLHRIARAQSSASSPTHLMNGVSMFIDPRRLPLARSLVAQFVNALCETLEQGERTHLYQLGLQIFPFGRMEALVARSECRSAH